MTRTGCVAVPDMARVLVVNGDAASRITLQAVLEAGGYHVDSVATASEAVSRMSSEEYELVLSDWQSEAPNSGLRVLAHAQLMTYEPATALLTTWKNLTPEDYASKAGSVLVTTEDIPELFTTVADLISERATRLIERTLRGWPSN